VRVKLGWRKREALLVNLSVTGCRLMTDRPVERGQSFRLQIPTERRGRTRARGGGARRRMPEQPRSGARPLRHLGELRRRRRAPARAALGVGRAHAEGPAVCAGAPPLALAAGERAAARARETGPDRPRRPSDPLDEEAAHVLMGRDLSRGGMRVDPNRCSRWA
jgi:hypothetical protein